MDQPQSTLSFLFPEVILLLDSNTKLANTAAPYHCHILHGKTNSSISIQTMHPATNHW